MQATATTERVHGTTEQVQQADAGKGLATQLVVSVVVTLVFAALTVPLIINGAAWALVLGAIAASLGAGVYAAAAAVRVIDAA